MLICLKFTLSFTAFRWCFITFSTPVSRGPDNNKTPFEYNKMAHSSLSD
ncbi:hypothetical protein ECDEC6B_0394 [Escherichia coli DEC6B]|nr:hypothetical protein ECDEC6B_0394 [Escherichia coli DEC6B]KDU37183.1 hypothetical protein AC86_2830 [Escherichia coli 3-073-06_S4_C1]KDZ81483.1 hypothetical protein AD42_3201 [Escherichia coli 3-073-06_S4_C3]KEN18525.1 hypothetical protein AC23_4777 [Escherichia coli 7-233-03_S3_C2]